MDKAPVTVNARVAELVAQAGASAAFGVVGSGNFDLTNQLVAAGIPFTAARHEGGAATMADAYTRTSSGNEFGVLTVHQGCGLTNAITGIGEAAKSSTGMLVLTADTPADAVASNFDIDQDSLVKSVGAVALRLDEANQVAAVMNEAFTALRARQTVVVSLPIDVQTQPVESELTPEPPAPRTGTVPQTSQVVRAAKSLAQAQRPVILAGRGALDAKAELVALADLCGGLVAASAVAYGIFEDHPWNIGLSGGFSSPVAAKLIQEADVLISFGSALNNWTTRHGELIGEDTTLIQVDNSPWAIGKYRAVSQTLVADAGAVAEALALEIPLHQEPDKVGYRTPEVAAQLKNKYWNSEDFEDLSSAECLDPRTLSKRLDELLPTERVVATDSGNFMGYPAAYLRIPDERGFCFTQAFQAIGLGLYTLVGAAIGQPQRLPVLGTGDGGMLMAISELETLVRLNIPALVVVYNDAAYGAEVHHFGQDQDLSAVTFPDTDFTAVATGYGAKGATIRTVEDLDVVTEWLDTVKTVDGRLSGTPLVLDVKIANDGGSWWLKHAFGH